ncbi:MAG: DUF3106 domain-containing protein [Candidatus Omnitrophica bacterium]|nr:DUF3106 domain-containing protein [Candidatus Omnitrophota bacterium]
MMRPCVRKDLLCAAFLMVSSCVFFSHHAQAQDAATVSAADDERYQANLKRWQSMTEDERQVIRARAGSMSEEEKGVLKEKAREYRAMPEPEREVMHENFKRYLELPQAQREILEIQQRQFGQLPHEKRAEIRRKIKEQRMLLREQAPGQLPLTQGKTPPEVQRPKDAKPLKPSPVKRSHKKKLKRDDQKKP